VHVHLLPAMQLLGESSQRMPDSACPLDDSHGDAA